MLLPISFDFLGRHVPAAAHLPCPQLPVLDLMPERAGCQAERFGGFGDSHTVTVHLARTLSSPYDGPMPDLLAEHIRWLLFRFRDDFGHGHATWDSFDPTGSPEWCLQALIGGWVVVFAIYTAPKLWRERHLLALDADIDGVIDRVRGDRLER